MPIYAYKCESCGFAKDVLQKISDQPLSVCPACGSGSYRKQLTAAGFQLKGSGWYATDFKGGGSGAPADGAGKDSAGKDGAAAPAKADGAADTRDTKGGKGDKAVTTTKAPDAPAAKKPEATGPTGPGT